MGLKATGSYVSRTLSYSGAEFSLAKVDIDPVFKCASSCCCFHSNLSHYQLMGATWVVFPFCRLLLL